MRMSNAILNKQDEDKKNTQQQQQQEMPERHLINESCVYAGEGEVLHPHPHPRLITQARTPIHTCCFYTSSVHAGRGRSVSREVGAVGRAAVVGWEMFVAL